MESFLSASEIARLALPGLPGSASGIRFHANRDNWPSRLRTGKGGGVEYCVQSLCERLPNDAVHYLHTALLNEVTSIPTASRTPKTRSPQRTFEARAALIAFVEWRAELVGINKAIDQLVRLAKVGWLPADLEEHVKYANARPNGRRTLTRRSLYRWRAKHLSQLHYMATPQKTGGCK